MYNCPTHGLNCPSNFSFNTKKLVLKNNRIGKPFGASDVNININRYESLDNIRKMLGLGNNNKERTHILKELLILLKTISAVRKST